MRSKVDSQVGSVLDSQPDIRKPTTSASQGSQRLMTWACATKWARKPSPPAPHSLPGPVPRASENQVAVICSESDGERDMDGVSCLSLQRIGRSVGNPCGERNEKALSFLSRRENEMNAASGRTFRCCAAKGRAFRRPKADQGSLRGHPSVNGPGAARRSVVVSPSLGDFVAWQSFPEAEGRPGESEGPPLSQWSGRREAECSGISFSRRFRRPSASDISPRLRRGLPKNQERDVQASLASLSWFFGGEKEIRTPDTLLGYTRFPGVPLQPLEHLSNCACKSNIFFVYLKDFRK